MKILCKLISRSRRDYIRKEARKTKIIAEMLARIIVAFVAFRNHS